MIRAETLEEAIEVADYAGEGVMVENCAEFDGRAVMIGVQHFDDLVYFSKVCDPNSFGFDVLEGDE